MVCQTVFQAGAAGETPLKETCSQLPLRRLTWENHEYKAGSKVPPHSRDLEGAWILV